VAWLVISGVFDTPLRLVCGWVGDLGVLRYAPTWERTLRVAWMVFSGVLRYAPTWERTLCVAWLVIWVQ
ncbi:MAG: hypothetical protein ACI308_08600, partial [Muribaculaceae bacterium]